MNTRRNVTEKEEERERGEGEELWRQRGTEVPSRVKESERSIMRG